MKMLRSPVVVLLCALLVVTAAAIGFIASGIYDVSALRPHTLPVYYGIKQTRDRAVERGSRNVQVPVLGDDAQVLRGMALLREHCVRCHGAPGVAPEPFALGLQPLATPLVQSGRNLPPRSLYWVIRNGIKMTAMPAFEFRMDEEGLWALVAAVMKLPGLSPADYRALTTGTPVNRLLAVSHEADPTRGKLAVGQYGCTACHTIPDMAGPDARVGPTLYGIGSRQMLGGVLSNSPENLARWIQSPQSVAPLTAMPELGVTERDARDMAAWLGSLK